MFAFHLFVFQRKIIIQLETGDYLAKFEVSLPSFVLQVINFFKYAFKSIFPAQILAVLYPIKLICLVGE